jgi:hypothetical protein
MRLAHPSRLLLATLAIIAAPLAAHAQDITASDPVNVSVTVYRNPYRGEGGFDLSELNGFALVTETRRVVLTPGLHRLRFEGVADGIEPASAIVTGLPTGVIEKNRDAALLSPAALIDAAEAQQGRVLLSSTTPNGVTTRREGTIRSGADGGVVFETPDGIEALRCSGLAESFSFEASRTGLSAKPTLSVQTRVTRRIEATVQLSYLARGFDWAADYVVSLSPDGRKVDVGGWITLANGNGIGFPNAEVQIVAGRLNRESGEVEPIDFGRPILARCWPRGSTSDPAEAVYIERAYPLGFEPGMFYAPGYPMPAPEALSHPRPFDRLQPPIEAGPAPRQFCRADHTHLFLRRLRQRDLRVRANGGHPPHEERQGEQSRHAVAVRPCGGVRNGGRRRGCAASASR